MGDTETHRVAVSPRHLHRVTPSPCLNNTCQKRQSAECKTVVFLMTQTTVT